MTSLSSKLVLTTAISLWLIFSAVFVGLFAFRADLYALTEIAPATLGELYPVSQNALSIEAIDTSEKQKLTLRLAHNPGCNQWLVSSTNSEPVMTTATNPTLTLLPGIQDYVVVPKDCVISAPAIDAIRLNIHFGLAESFTVQNIATDQVQINSANIPIIMDTPVLFERWVPDVKSFSAQEYQRALKILINEGYDSAWSTRRKIEFIATLVRQKMIGGAPPEYLNTLSPLSVFDEASTGKAGVFCRQWSLGYGYLANVAGIPTRNMFTGGAMNTVDMGSHAFSESYIEEEARWAYVDPTNDIAYVTNAKNEILSGADIYMASITANDQGLTAHTLADGNIANVPYIQASQNVRYFMHRENFLIYIGGYDGRYQMDGQGISKYVQKLYRFLFQPQQYFGLMHFTSYPGLRAASFFLALFFGILSFAMALKVSFSTKHRVH